VKAIEPRDVANEAISHRANEQRNADQSCGKESIPPHAEEEVRHGSHLLFAVFEFHALVMKATY
jgi:hypothetical protein